MERSPSGMSHLYSGPCFDKVINQYQANCVRLKSPVTEQPVYVRKGPIRSLFYCLLLLLNQHVVRLVSLVQHVISSVLSGVISVARASQVRGL